MGLVYSTTETFESKIAPGVTYKLRKMSHKRRMKLNEVASSIYARIDEVQRQLSPIDEEIKRAEEEAKIEPCTCTHEPLVQEKDTDPPQHDPQTLRCIKPGCKCREPKPDPEIGDYTKKLKLQVDVMSIVIGELYPEYIKWGVSDIQGLEIDGKPATTESLLDDAPEALVAELGEEIQRLIRLSPEEVMGFPRPIISGGQVDGPTTDTTAPSANSTASTRIDIAASTSQT